MSEELARTLDNLLVEKPWINVLLGPSTSSAEDCNLLFLKSRINQPLETELAQKLASQIVNYCIPAKERLAAIEFSNKTGDTSKILELQKQAKELFLEFNEKFPHRFSEGGELLAYCLTEHFLKAPLLLSKMSLKTNHNMPIHGSDGIHVRFNKTDGVLELIYLEAKVYKDFNGGISAAVSSLKEFVTENAADNEIRLIGNLSSLDALDEESRGEIENYLDPYGSNTTDRYDCYSITLVTEKYDYSEECEFNKLNELINKKLDDDYGEIKASAIKKLKEQAFDANRTKIFVVILPSVSNFRSLFNEALK